MLSAFDIGHVVVPSKPLFVWAVLPKSISNIRVRRGTASWIVFQVLSYESNSLNIMQIHCIQLAPRALHRSLHTLTFIALISTPPLEEEEGKLNPPLVLIFRLFSSLIYPSRSLSRTSSLSNTLRRAGLTPRKGLQPSTRPQSKSFFPPSKVIILISSQSHQALSAASTPSKGFLPNCLLFQLFPHHTHIMT